MEKYLNKIKPYLKDIINNPEIYDTQNIELTRAIKIISSKDTDEERVMHSNSDNIKIMLIKHIKQMK